MCNEHLPQLLCSGQAHTSDVKLDPSLFLSYLFNYHLAFWPCLNPRYKITPPTTLFFISGFVFFITFDTSWHIIFYLHIISHHPWMVGDLFSITLYLLPACTWNIVGTQYIFLKNVKQFLIKSLEYMTSGNILRMEQIFLVRNEMEYTLKENLPVNKILTLISKELNSFSYVNYVSCYKN